MKRLIFSFAVLFFLIGITGMLYAQEESTVFDETFVQKQGKPLSVCRTFNVASSGPGIMRLTNGKTGGSCSQTVSSAQINLNGTTIVNSCDFKNHNCSFEKAVELNQGKNKLAVRLKSRPGGTLRVEVVQESDQLASAIFDVQSVGGDYCLDLIAQGDPDAFGKTIEWFKAQPNVEDAGVSEDQTTIWILYSSGFEGLIDTRPFETFNVESLTAIELSAQGAIKNSEQLAELKSEVGAASSGDEKKAVILLPISSETGQYDATADLVHSTLESIGYDVDGPYRNEDVTVDRMKDLDEYNFIYMTTHGLIDDKGNVTIIIGEEAEENTFTGKYHDFIAGITKGLYIVTLSNGKTTYAFNRYFFDNYTYPSSFVYMNACHALESSTLADAFLENGAKAYMGWNNLGLMTFSDLHGPDFFHLLSQPNVSLEEAYNETVAPLYPATTYNDDDGDGERRYTLADGRDKSDRDDMTVWFTTSFLYRGDPQYRLNFQPDNEGVTFPDPNLETLIREALSKPTGQITRSDLEKITDLYQAPFPERPISSLEGLQYCINLESLALGNAANQISNISPLASLTKLYSLILENYDLNDRGRISDISLLANLTTLYDLRLDGNQISDISPLANLTNLGILSLRRNQISDIAPLLNLQGVGYIFLEDNPLNSDACDFYIPELRSRGAAVAENSCVGYVSVSQGGIVSPNPVVLGQDFTISFALKETHGYIKEFDNIAIAILDPSGTFIFDFATFWSPGFSPGETQIFSSQNYLYTTRLPGTYRAVIRGEIGGQWFDFDTVDSGVNPVSFNVVRPPEGYCSVSQGVTISPATPVLGQNFTISFTLQERWGVDKTFDNIAIAILDPSGTFIFDFAVWDSATIPANGTKSYSAENNIYASRPPGTYQAVARGKYNGTWFDFDTVDAGLNPKSFSVVP